MSKTIRVFVNATALELAAGAKVAEAVSTYDPTLLANLASGAAYVTDGRGIEIDSESALANGAILRVVVRAHRGTDADA
jgi:hypothetical protein